MQSRIQQSQLPRQVCWSWSRQLRGYSPVLLGMALALGVWVLMATAPSARAASLLPTFWQTAFPNTEVWELSTPHEARAQRMTRATPPQPLDIVAVKQGDWWATVQAHIRADVAASLPPLAPEEAVGWQSGLRERFAPTELAVSNASSARGVNATPVLTLTGEATGNAFGGSVASTGDVNGDGYADFVVGASGYNSDQGRVYLYLGGASGLGAMPAMTLTGEATNNAFGFSVTSAGDVNGDGYSDLVVGAVAYNVRQGRAYLYLGGANSVGATPALTLTGETLDNYFGFSVASAGDVNGDSYSDLVVGAVNYNNGRGRAYLYLGSASGVGATPALTLTGETIGNAFGRSVASAGDVNGDGYSDLVVGAWRYNSQQGRVYLYLGGASGVSATPALTLTGEATANGFGYSVASAGDVNGDGYSDLVIGVIGYNNQQGCAYLYLGSASGVNATPALTLTGEATNDLFGSAVANAGDVNGDGYADLVVEAIGYNSFQGRTYLYLGGASGLNATPALTLTGEATNNFFGASVASAGDVNGDGYSDLVVGAAGYNGSQGRVYVYYGQAGVLSASANPTLMGEAPNNFFGTSVASAGDVNGDGYSDLIVGASDYNNQQGRAYLYLGSASGVNATPVLTLTGETSSRFGSSAASAGDVNGDGYGDLVVGAIGYNNQQGRAYLYLGSVSGVSAIPALTLTGEATFNHLGFSVASAGDVNGNGYADLVVGAMGYNGDQGRAYLHLGNASGVSATPTLTLTGEATGNAFGGSVASAGDVNGDGYADLVVGAYFYNSGQGRAYLYLGNAGGVSATPALTLTGEASSSFGVAVASAGDVNGDGYADLVIGAVDYLTNTGRAYLYLGSASGVNATPALTLTGEATSNYFGLLVASAGDVNGDGYTDLVIGAIGYLTNTGRAYLYLGSASVVGTIPALTLTGEATFNYFGVSVASAGDVNGDGYADLVVGASLYNSNQGRVYIYAGNEHAGLSLVPRLRSSDNSAPIANGGKSDNPNSFRLAALGRTPFGRGKVKLEWEVKPLGTLFNGSGTSRSATWLDTGTAGAVLNELVTSLSANMAYHWRVRLRYHPAASPAWATMSRWLSPPWNGWNETDVWTLGAPITGLSFTVSPTPTVGAATFFTATATSGTGITYSWSVNGTPIGSSNPISYTFTTAGTYTVTVTATNALGFTTTTQSVLVVDNQRSAYLPLVVR